MQMFGEMNQEAAGTSGAKCLKLRSIKVLNFICNYFAFPLKKEKRIKHLS